jgi:hypothetical protein
VGEALLVVLVRLLVAVQAAQLRLTPLQLLVAVEVHRRGAQAAQVVLVEQALRQ